MKRADPAGVAGAPPGGMATETARAVKHSGPAGVAGGASRDLAGRGPAPGRSRSGPETGEGAAPRRDAARPDHEVALVGMGAFSPLGRNCAEMRRALLEGRDSLARVGHFDTRRFTGDVASSFGAETGVEMDAEAASWMDRATLLAVPAYREAVRQAGVDPRHLDPERVGVCLGSSHSGLVRTEEVARRVIAGGWEGLRPRIVAATLVSHCTAVIKRMSGARGRIVTVSSACASSNSALGIGADLIRKGEMDLVIAGGSDTLSLSVMAGFNALRAIARGKTAPFSYPVGLNIGEGAGIVVLKRADLPLPGCGRPLARVLGYGLSCDAYHATAPDPEGSGSEQAMRAALEDGGLDAAGIDYVNAHGTGTEANDRAESRAVHRLFGDAVPLSSTKSFFGHTLGASGVLETIATLLLVNEGLAPPGLRMDTLREGCAPLDYVRHRPRRGAFRTVMINNFGFGGNNSALIVRAGGAPLARRPSRAPSAAVVVTGVGVTSGAGAGFPRFREALGAGAALARRDPESGIDAVRCPALRFTDPRLRPFARSAPATRYAIAALGEALGAGRPAYDHDPRSGLVSGVVFGAQRPTEKYMESVFAGDPALANAHYFPMITMNATGSACALAFGVTGYATTLCGSAAGLCYAAELVRDDRQDRVAMVSGDELSPRLLEICWRAGVVRRAAEKRPGRAAALGEFAAALALEREGSALRRKAPVPARLAGWAHCQDPLDLSVARSGASLQRAIAAARRMAGLGVSDIGLVSLLDRGLAPARRACRHALRAVFGEGPPQVVRAAEVFGFAPSGGALMSVAAALAVAPRKGGAPRHVLAAGYDVVGDAFAFVLERAAP